MDRKKDKKEKKEKKKKKDKKKDDKKVASSLSLNPVGLGSALAPPALTMKSVLGGEKGRSKSGGSPSDSDVEAREVEEAQFRERDWEEKKREMLDREEMAKEEWERNRQIKFETWINAKEQEFRDDMGLYERRWQGEKDEAKERYQAAIEGFEKLRQEQKAATEKLQSEKDDGDKVLAKRKAEMDNEVTKLDARKAAAAKEAEAAVTEISKEKKKAEGSLAVLKDEVAHARVQLTEQQEDMAKQREEMKVEHEAQKKKVAADAKTALTEQLRTQEVDCAEEIAKAKKAHEATLANLNAELAEATATTEAAKLTASQAPTSSPASTSPQDSPRSRAHLEEQVAARASLEAEVRELKGEVARLATEAGEATDLRASITKLQAEAITLGESLGEQDVIRQRAEEELDLLRAEVRETSNAQEFELRELQSLTRQVAEADEVRTALEAKLVKAEEQVETAAALAVKAQEDAQQTNNGDLARLQELITVLERQIEVLKKEKVELQRKLSDAQVIPTLGFGDENKVDTKEWEQRLQDSEAALTLAQNEVIEAREEAAEAQRCAATEVTNLQERMDRLGEDDEATRKVNRQLQESEEALAALQETHRLDRERWTTDQALAIKKLETTRGTKERELKDTAEAAAEEVTHERKLRAKEMAQAEEHAEEQGRQVERLTGDLDRLRVEARERSAVGTSDSTQEVDRLAAELDAERTVHDRTREELRKEKRTAQREVAEASEAASLEARKRTTEELEKKTSKLQRLLEEAQEEREQEIEKHYTRERALKGEIEREKAKEIEREEMRDKERADECLAAKLRAREHQEEEDQERGRERERQEETRREAKREEERVEEAAFRERVLSQGKGMGERERERETQRQTERDTDRGKRATRDQEREAERGTERRRQEEMADVRAASAAKDKEKLELEKQLAERDLELKRGRDREHQLDLQLQHQGEGESVRERQLIRERDMAKERESEVDLERRELRERVLQLERDLDQQRERERQADSERKRERDLVRGKDRDLGKEVETEVERLKALVTEREGEMKGERRKWFEERSGLKEEDRVRQLARLSEEEEERKVEQERTREELRVTVDRLTAEHQRELLALQARAQSIASTASLDVSGAAKEVNTLRSDNARMSAVVQSLQASLRRWESESRIPAEEQKVSTRGAWHDTDEVAEPLGVLQPRSSNSFVPELEDTEIRNKGEAPRRENNRGTVAYFSEGEENQGAVVDVGKWEARVAPERGMIAQVKAYLRDQRETIRGVQRALQQEQEDWKRAKRSFKQDEHEHSPTKRSRYDALQSRKERLDQEARSLNADVREIRRIQSWINLKDERLAAIEAKVGGVSSSTELDREWNTYLLADADKAGVEMLDDADVEAIDVDVPHWATQTGGGRAVDGRALDLELPDPVYRVRPYSDVHARVGALRGMLRKWNNDRSGLQGSLQNHFDWLKAFSGKLRDAQFHAKLTPSNKLGGVRPLEAPMAMSKPIKATSDDNSRDIVIRIKVDR